MKKTHFLVILLAGLFYFSNAQDCEVTISGSSLVCSLEETTTLTASPGFESYYWNNGQTGPTVEVGYGTHKVYAVSSNGCLAYSEFKILSPLELTGPAYFYSVRVEDSLILDAVYNININNPDLFSFTWTFNGQVIGDEHIVKIDTVGHVSDIHELSVSIYDNCQELITTERSYQISGFATEEVEDTLYVCADISEIYSLYLPISKTGTYKLTNVFVFGNEESTVNHYEFLEDSCAINDTINMCFPPIEYDNKIITSTGPYTFLDVAQGSDTFKRVNLEVIAENPFKFSFNTLEVCGEGPYQYDGTSYSGQPGLYRQNINIGEECDSVSFLRVAPVVSPLITTLLDTAICANKTLEWQGEVYEPGEVYEFSYPLEYDCDSTVLLSIESIELPTLSKEFTICEGDTITVDGQSFFEAGSYTYTKEGSIGCDTTVNVAILDNIPILVFDEFILPDDGNSSGAIFINLSGGAPPYQLNWSNGSNLQNILGLDAGVYELEVTDDNGCSAIFTYEVPLVLSTKSNQESSGIQIFPNPTTGILNIHWQGKSKTQLSIYALDGTLVWAGQISNNTQQIDISAMPAGMYFIQARNNSGLWQQKIVRQ
jgi:hypothetical protein